MAASARASARAAVLLRCSQTAASASASTSSSSSSAAASVRCQSTVQGGVTTSSHPSSSSSSSPTPPQSPLSSQQQQQLQPSSPELDPSMFPTLTKAPNARLVELDTQREHRRHWREAVSFMDNLGSSQTSSTEWKPSYMRTKPPSAREVTLSHLMAATAHVGHGRDRINAAYRPFIYGLRHGIAQIDVERATLPALRRAARVVKEVTLRDGVVLIVGGGGGAGTAPNRDVQRAVIEAARRMGANGFHIARERWAPGVLTNAHQLLERAVDKDLKSYESAWKAQRGQRAAVALARVQAGLEEEPQGMAEQMRKAGVRRTGAVNPQRTVGGGGGEGEEELVKAARADAAITATGGAGGEGAGSDRNAASPADDDSDYASVFRSVYSSNEATPTPGKFAKQVLRPDLIIFLDPKANQHAIREATKCHVPTIGIVDTDVDPRAVTYPIPANDESTRVQELIVGVLSKAGEEGVRQRKVLEGVEKARGGAGKGGAKAKRRA